MVKSNISQDLDAALVLFNSFTSDLERAADSKIPKIRRLTVRRCADEGELNEGLENLVDMLQCR